MRGSVVFIGVLLASRDPRPVCLATAEAALMKRLVGILALIACAPALGCGAREGSSEGVLWNLVLYGPREKVTPEQIQKAEDAFRARPSKIPGMERFEWGRIENSRSSHTHCLLVTFKEAGEIGKRSEEYRKLLKEAAEGYRFMPREFVVHDATPHARTATRGHLRRVVLFQLIKEEPNPEEVRTVEDAMSALPSKIPAIERLQWGTETFFSPSKDFPTIPDHCLLLTFKDSSARDACLADPAYKELEKLLKQHVREPFEWEYVARGVRD